MNVISTCLVVSTCDYCLYIYIYILIWPQTHIVDLLRYCLLVILFLVIIYSYDLTIILYINVYSSWRELHVIGCFSLICISLRIMSECMYLSYGVSALMLSSIYIFAKYDLGLDNLSTQLWFSWQVFALKVVVLYHFFFFLKCFSILMLDCFGRRTDFWWW